MKTINRFTKLFFILSFIIAYSQTLGQRLTADVGADIVSSYVWRGLEINTSPNIQPSLAFDISGLSFGFWGSYSMSTKNAADDDYTFSSEIDTWISYTQELDNGMSISAIATDYYFPNAGIKFGNFNNYDDPAGPGAHTIEVGILLSGPESFPFSVSGYTNIHNDAGSNSYFQINYSTSIEKVLLDFFVGATPGSEENPGYYGTDSFNIINVGVKASKEIMITNDFSLPVNASVIFNSKADAAYMVFGISL